MIINDYITCCRRRRTKEWEVMTPQEGKERGPGGLKGSKER
jgi:hypothetical protein